ncbi:MAG: hypothetical protein U9N51_03135 [Bacteroidota bacterium]|nr:hypothetical protein [Bacteroidota bacterium]
MKKAILIGLLIVLPGLMFAQEQVRDSSPELSDYFIRNIEEIPYDKQLLDTVPGFDIAIIPPEHFIFAKDVPGYIHAGTSTSIQIKEIDGTSWPIIDRAMTAEHFESQGVNFISREEVNLKSGLSGVIYTISFKAKGIAYERIMLFAGDYNKTIWINANYPVIVKKTVIKPIINSLMSADII